MIRKDQEKEIMAMVFPFERAREFLCNDFYQELLEVIPPYRCISPFNVIKIVRIKNLTTIRRDIVKFLIGNIDYVNAIKDLYDCKDIDRDILNRLIFGYVFFIAKTNKEYEKVNILTDERSVCYYDIALLHLLSEKVDIKKQSNS